MRLQAHDSLSQSTSPGRCSRSRSRRDADVAGLGNDPIPLHLGLADAPLRLPCLAARCDVDHARPRRDRDGCVIFDDARQGPPKDGRAAEVPLMSAMYLAMVWHARRRQDAMDELAALAARQERFLHDASHELRTPITIARGPSRCARAERAMHTSLRSRRTSYDGWSRSSSAAAARQGRPAELPHARRARGGAVPRGRLPPLVGDRPRRIWRLGSVAAGTLEADADAVRLALDALIENAVEAHAAGRDDRGQRAPGRRLRGDRGVGRRTRHPADALERIFERFGRADPARTRSAGGVASGCPIVGAIVKAHGGMCTVRSDEQGTIFSLYMPLRRTLASSSRELVRTSR